MFLYIAHHIPPSVEFIGCDFDSPSLQRAQWCTYQLQSLFRAEALMPNKNLQQHLHQFTIGRKWKGRILFISAIVKVSYYIRNEWLTRQHKYPSARRFGSWQRSAGSTSDKNKFNVDALRGIWTSNKRMQIFQIKYQFAFLRSKNSRIFVTYCSRISFCNTSHFWFDW